MKKQKPVDKPYPQNFPLGPEPINEVKLDILMSRQLPEWVVLKSSLPENPYQERVELFREYKFSSFEAVIRFMSNLTEGCEVLMHHPRWENIWRTLRVYTTTWDIGHKISDRDIQLARYFDREYNKFEAAADPTKVSISKLASKGFVVQLKEDIEKNRLREVGEKLKEFFMLNSDNDSVNSSIQLLARINEVQKREMLATIKAEEAKQEYSQIRNALLYIIDNDLERGNENAD